MHEVCEFAAYADIRTNKLYFIRKEEDGELADRRIRFRVTRPGGNESVTEASLIPICTPGSAPNHSRPNFFRRMIGQPVPRRFPVTDNRSINRPLITIRLILLHLFGDAPPGRCRTLNTCTVSPRMANGMRYLPRRSPWISTQTFLP